MFSSVNNDFSQSATAATATSPVNDGTASKINQITTLYAKLYESYSTQTSPMEFGMHCRAATKLVGEISTSWIEGKDFPPTDPNIIKWRNLSEDACIDLFRENVTRMACLMIDRAAHNQLSMVFHLFSEEQRVEVSSNCRRNLDGIVPVNFYLEIQPLVPERWKANLLQTAFISRFVQKGEYSLAKGRFIEIMESLAEGEVFFLHGGTNSHARIYAIKRDLSGHYELAIIDTGVGCTEIEGKHVALIYQGLEQQLLLDSKMLDLLIKKHGGFWAANPFPKINQAIQNLLGQEPTHRRIVGQRYGTCVASSLIEAFSLYASQEENKVLKKRLLNYTVAQVARAQLQLTALGRHVRASEEGKRLQQDINYLRHETNYYIPISEGTVELPQRLRIRFQTLVLELMNLVDSIEREPELDTTLRRALKPQVEQEDQPGCGQFNHFLRLVVQGNEYQKAFARSNPPQAQNVLRWAEALSKLMGKTFENQEGPLFESVEKELWQSKINVAKARVILEEHWAIQGIEVPLKRRVSSDGKALLEGQFNIFGGFDSGQARFTNGETWEGAFDPTLRTVTLRHGKMRRADGSVLAGRFRGNELFNGTNTQGEESYKIKNGYVVPPKKVSCTRRQREEERR